MQGASIGLSGYGLISHPNDVDVFKFTSAAGQASFTVKPLPLSPNLDVMIELRDQAGNVLASANPIDALDATLNLNLGTGGTYYLAVQNTGKGGTATGYSDYGSLGWYTITGTAPASGIGQPPVAVLATSATSGATPLAVQFDGSQSSDPEGSALTYRWTFGDGQSSSEPRVSYVYSAGGNFTATLTVTDASGLTDSKSVTITAVAPTAPMWIQSIELTRQTQKAGTTASASVTVRKLDSTTGAVLPVVGATVSGQWNGVVSGSALGTTDANGVVTVRSPRTKARTGTFTFSVSGVALEPNRYESTRNVETSDSISF